MVTHPEWPPPKPSGAGLVEPKLPPVHQVAARPESRPAPPRPGGNAAAPVASPHLQDAPQPEPAREWEPADQATLLRNLRTAFPRWAFLVTGPREWTAVRGAHQTIVRSDALSLRAAVATADYSPIPLHGQGQR